MTAAAQPRPYLSGFCGYSGRHDLCVHPVPGMACSCRCHSPEPSAPAPTDVAPAALVLISESGRERQPDLDLGDTLLHLAGDIGALSRTLGSFVGSDVEVCDLLGQIRRERQRLAEVEAALERQAAQLMTQDVVEWTGGTAERRWGKDRKEWRHDDLARAVTAAIIPPLAVDPTTGEVDSDLATLLHQAVEQYAATNRPSWRVTAVKPLGIDPDEYCSAVPGRPSVAVHLADEDKA